MSVWQIAPVTEEPSVTLKSWRIFKTSDGSRHFVGADVRDNTGRISTEIVLFDRNALRGRTISGRIYQLTGGTERSVQADYVWERWCEVNNIESFTDVTSELLIGTEADNAAE